MTIFNENARQVMAATGVTITDLAEQIGMHRESLSKILNGRVDPTSSTLDRIADGLSTPLWELLKPAKASQRKAMEKVA